jgi:hypothetical protein
MRSILLALFFLGFGCLAHAYPGGGGHGGSGGYSHGGGGYHRSYRGAYYAPYGYDYGGYYGYDYPFSYDDGTFYDASSDPGSTPVSTNSVPPVSAPPAAASVTTPDATTSPPTAKKPAANQIPFGFDIGTKLIKSPWSNFVINGANKAPEQVVYDANTGQAFRIPPP